MASLQRAGHIADVLGCAITLADIEIVQGRLTDAMRTYERSLRLAADQDGPVLRGTADMYVGMAALHRERDDLPAATQLLLAEPGAGRAPRDAAEPATARGSRWPGSERPRETWTARVELLDDAERVYVGDFSPDVRPIPAVRARVWVAQGRFDDALGWAREQTPVRRGRPELPA